MFFFFLACDYTIISRLCLLGVHRFSFWKLTHNLCMHLWGARWYMVQACIGSLARASCHDFMIPWWWLCLRHLFWLCWGVWHMMASFVPLVPSAIKYILVILEFLDVSFVFSWASPGRVEAVLIQGCPSPGWVLAVASFLLLRAAGSQTLVTTGPKEKESWVLFI